jgi:hypothetical protein
VVSDPRREPAAGAAVTPSSIRAGQVIDVAGVGMRVWAADDARAEAMASMLRAALPASGPPSAEVRFEDGAAPRIQWSGAGPYEVRRERPDLVSVRSDLGFVARVTPDRVVVVGDAPNLGAAFRPVFSFAIAHLLAWRDRHVLHAAALSVDDGCVLVLGPTGAGKSTVALCALRCGWPVLGDDLVALAPLGDRILATAVPRPIAAPRDLVDDPRAVPVAGDARERLELPPGTTTPGTRRVLGLIVVAHADSPKSTARELRAFAVPPLVLASCLVADSAESRRSLFPLAAALSRLPTVELAHGTRSGTRLEDGAALLEEIRTRFTLARNR